MSFFKTITQGGQVHIHQLHMLKQVVMTGLIVALIGGGGHFIWESVSLPYADWRQAYESYWARFMLVSTPDEKHSELYQLYVPPHGQPYERRILNVIKDPFIQKTTKKVETFVKKTAYQSLGVGGIALFIILGVWFFIGLSQRRARHERGNTLVHWKTLASILKRNEQASDLKFGRLPLLKGKETSHVLVTGTTGSGKTNGFHILLPQIRERGDRAIVVDMTGDYVSRYYDETTDLILNPLDLRSLHWHPWEDCTLDFHYDVLAESLIQPKEGNRDPFWDNASRVILKTALRKYASQDNFDIEKLYRFLLSASDQEFEDFFLNTEAATFAFKKNEKTTHSIRSVLSSQIESFRHLETLQFGLKNVSSSVNELRKKAFSIREWVAEETCLNSAILLERKKRGWLFITARADQRQTLAPLMSAWVDIAINALMVMPESQTRRLWFIIDELAGLQKLPRLSMGLAEGRKYGGCFLLGFQSKPQLEEIYGRNAAEVMLDLFNTKIFFRCTEPSTQQWVSKVIGEKEEAEATENISFGANSLRDGVSLGRQTRQKPLIIPSELSLLKDLECYLKYPGNYPSTKIQTYYQSAPSHIKSSFLLKPEKKRKYA